MRFTQAETDAILAALHYWQDNRAPVVIYTDESGPIDYTEIESNGGAHAPLTDDDLLALRERINTAPEPTEGPALALAGVVDRLRDLDNNDPVKVDAFRWLAIGVLDGIVAHLHNEDARTREAAGA